MEFSKPEENFQQEEHQKNEQHTHEKKNTHPAFGNRTSKPKSTSLKTNLCHEPKWLCNVVIG